MFGQHVNGKNIIISLDTTCTCIHCEIEKWNKRYILCKIKKRSIDHICKCRDVIHGSLFMDCFRRNK